MVDGRMITEASGRITPETAVPIAEAGVDLISVGWLTHSRPGARHRPRPPRLTPPRAGMATDAQWLGRGYPVPCRCSA